MRKEFMIGILMMSLDLLLKRFVNVPDFISGILLGGACCLFIISVIPVKHFETLKNWKSERLAILRK